MFKDSETIRERSSQWVDEMLGTLPVGDDSREFLKERAAGGLQLRRKIQSILQKPHVRDMTLDRFKQALNGHGIPIDAFIQNDTMVITKENEKAFLQLLNEAYYLGEFSGIAYESSSKRERQP